MPLPIDVTDELRRAGHLTGADRNDEDRVYRFEDLLVKVKTWRDTKASSLTSVVYRVSGSIVGEDGKALRDTGGKPMVQAQPRTLIVYPETPTDFIVDVERERFACVRESVAGYRNALQGSALTGVGVL